MLRAWTPSWAGRLDTVSLCGAPTLPSRSLLFETDALGFSLARLRRGSTCIVRVSRRSVGELDTTTMGPHRGGSPLHPGDASSAIDDVRSTVSHASMWRRDVQADKGISRACCGCALTGPRASLPPSQRAPERSGKSSCFSLKSRSTSMSAACAAAREPAMADTEAAISSPTRRYRLSATLTVPRHVAHPDAPLVSYLHDSLAYLSGTLPRATRITPLTSRGLNEPCK